jgi:hypothetical protein
MWSLSWHGWCSNLGSCAKRCWDESGHSHFATRVWSDVALWLDSGDTRAEELSAWGE